MKKFLYGIVWRTCGRDTEGLYGQLLDQTHFKPYLDAIDWQPNDAIGGSFGSLAPVIAMLDGELAANPQTGRALVNEFGRILRGLKLTGGAANDYNYDLERRAA